MLLIIMVDLPMHLVTVPLHTPFCWQCLTAEPNNMKFSLHSIVTVSLTVFPVITTIRPYSGVDNSGHSAKL